MLVDVPVALVPVVVVPVVVPVVGGVGVGVAELGNVVVEPARAEREGEREGEGEGEGGRESDVRRVGLSLAAASDV